MSQVIINVSHDCEKPPMIAEVKVRRRRGLSTLFKTVEDQWNSYEAHRAMWDCPECGSSWEYRPGYKVGTLYGFDYITEGDWYARNRTKKWVLRGGDWNSEEVDYEEV